MICLPLIRQALDPSFSSFKTQKGWRFLHQSQVLFACLLSGLYNGTTCLARSWFTQENRAHIRAWRNRCPTLHQHSARVTALFMHRGFVCFNAKPTAVLRAFASPPGDHFVEWVQIFTRETGPTAETFAKGLLGLT